MLRSRMGASFPKGVGTNVDRLVCCRGLGNTSARAGYGGFLLANANCRGVYRYLKPGLGCV
jgi:hypothetical protein